jgi:hypothetical protein
MFLNASRRVCLIGQIINILALEIHILTLEFYLNVFTKSIALLVKKVQILTQLRQAQERWSPLAW